jgi:hypothetical protein
MPFQTTVGVQPAFAVAGDFASSNPRFTVDVGAGGMIAGTGLYVGRFAWTFPPLDPEGTATVANCSGGSGTPTGFVHREQQGIITTYLAETTMQVAPGFQTYLFNGGDFWVVNSGTTLATVGMKAYANYATGLVSFAATGSPTTGASSATSTIAAGTASVTGSIAGNVMTVTAVGSGTLYPGAPISGSSVASGTTIVSQISGTNGGVGTYYVTPDEQTVASTTISETYGLFTAVGAVSGGSFAVGDILSGSGVTSGTTIIAMAPNGALTGTGGLGTYAVQTTQSASSATISATSNVETKWVAMSTGLAGELVKMSDHLLG